MEGATNPDQATAVDRLPLRDTHAALGARFTTFSGWEMPLSYTSIIDEHLQVRTRAGLFDVSHMGRLLLRGAEAFNTVQNLVATDLSGLLVGQAKYTVLLTPLGHILDDLIVYRREDGIQLIVNAGRRAEDRAWIIDHFLGEPGEGPDDPGLELDDLTEITCLFALQGPASFDALGAVIEDLDPAALASFSFAPARLAGADVTVMRTGYTGEEGVEIMTTVADGVPVWQALLSAGAPGTVAPCGLGARDTLRLEAGLLLYGQDITTNTTPFEARLGWLTHLQLPGHRGFVGRDALLAASVKGPEKLLVGLATESRPIPRHGDDLAVGAELVGKVTSGSYSPVLRHGIALGYVLPRFASAGTAITVASGEKEVPATIVDLPFYRRGVTPIPPRRRAPVGPGTTAPEATP